MKYSTKPKILIFQFSDKWGGIETYVQNELMPLSVYYDFYLIAVDASNSMIKRVGIYRNHVYNLSGKDSLSLRFRKIWKILKSDKFDIVYFNKNSAAKFWPVAMARLLTSARIVVHSHNTRPSAKGVGRCFHYLFRPIVRRCADVKLACSAVAAKYMFGDSWNHAEIIPNGIDLNQFIFSPESRNQIRNSLGISATAQVFINVGRLSSQKNQDFLLPIFKKYNECNKDSYMIFLGNGEEEKNLTFKISQMGLSSNVLMLGNKENVAQYLSAADIGLFPSLYEGLPIALIEAQANGLPIISSMFITRELAITQNVNFVQLDSEDWFSELEILSAQESDFEMRRRTGRELRGSRFDRDTSIAKIDVILKNELNK